MKTILLTGATGFLGSHLLKTLTNKGYDIVITKRSISDVWRLDDCEKKIKSYDIDKKPLRLIFEENHIEGIIHTACVYGRKNENISAILDTNLIFGTKLLDLALEFGTKVFLNTDTLLPKKLNMYALSKKQFAEWLQFHSEKIQVLNFRIEHMFGEKDGNEKFTSWLLSQFMKEAPEINLTSGTQQRDFIYIDDVVSAYVIGLENLDKLHTFNDIDVGTGDFTEVRYFVELLKRSYEELTSKEVSTQLNFGKIPYRKNEIMIPELDNTLLKNLGWQPQGNLQDNIRKFIKKELK